MQYFSNGLLLGLAALALGSAALPATYDDYVGVLKDVVSVGSLRREVRQPAPPGLDLAHAGNEPKKNNKKVIKNSKGKSDSGVYYRTYGSDADGEKGYEKQTHSKGNSGYKTHDAFHRRNGDNYGFEEHEAFGRARGEDAQSKDARRHKSKHADHEGAGTYAGSYYSEDGDHAGYTDDGGEGYAHYGDGDGSYDHSANEGYSESYSSDGDDGGSYESHSSYTSDGDGSDEDYY